MARQLAILAVLFLTVATSHARGDLSTEFQGLLSDASARTDAAEQIEVKKYLGEIEKDEANNRQKLKRVLPAIKQAIAVKYTQKYGRIVTIENNIPQIHATAGYYMKSESGAVCMMMLDFDVDDLQSGLPGMGWSNCIEPKATSSVVSSFLFNSSPTGFIVR